MKSDMNKKVLTIIISCMMTLTIMPLAVHADSQLELNSKARHEVCNSLSESARDYYTGTYSYGSLKELPGAPDDSDSYLAMQNNPLYDKLQELMQTTMDEQSLPVYSGYAAGSLAYYWSWTDTSPDLDNTKNSHFLMFYSDVGYEYPGANYTMNREHIWPKSHASFYQTNGGSDLHHLRPSVASINEAKSDRIFGYIDEVYTSGFDVGEIAGNEVYKAYPDKDVFEPKDDVKGDVARILLYVYCCWGQPNLYSDVSDDKLPVFDPDDTTNTGGRVIADLDTLLTWCADDPVDTWEMERNDIIQAVQGNRNVFIDYPEFAWKMFGRRIPAGIQTPMHTGCSHNYADPVILYDSCIKPGTRTRICTVCGNEHTTPAPIMGHVDENNDSRCDRCNASLLGSFQAADNVAAGDHIIIYHSASGKAITPVVNSKSQLNGTQAVEYEGKMIPTDDTAVFCLEDAGDGGFYLIRNGKYLTTTRSGSKLLWTDDKDDAYIIWLIESAGDGGFYIVNASAGSSTEPYAVEYFNSSFTTYGLTEESRDKDKDAGFRFKLFSIHDHVWEETTRTEPTCTEPGNAKLKCVACGAEDAKAIEASGHKWGNWQETMPATAAKEGEETHTCSICGEKETRAIPVKKPDPAPGSDPNQKGTDGTAVGPGASAASADKAITSMTSDSDPKGSVYNKLKFRSTNQTKNAITLKWTTPSKATKYVLYGNMCGARNKMKKLATYTGSGKKLTKVAGKTIKKGTYYKFILVALDKNNNIVSTSKVIHIAAKGGKVTNPKKVTVKKGKKSVSNVTVKKGKSITVKNTVTKESKKLTLKTHRKVKYETSNKKIATVTSKGKIKGVKKGTCYIYAYAQNGISKKVKVVVK